MMGAVFLADLSAARAALPRSLEPLALPLGKALVAVHAMEYKDTDIGPYNEVSVSIAVRRGWGLPLRSMFQTARSAVTGVYNAHVVSLPVTTETAVHGGVDFFNYPKYLADVTFRETAAHRVCTLRDKASGDVILELEGRRLPTWSCAPSNEDLMILHTYPEIGGRLMRATMRVNRVERGVAHGRGVALRLGPHARAGQLGALKLGVPVEYVYAPRCQAVLFEPEDA
jgi:hypothetical protein